MSDDDTVMFYKKKIITVSDVHKAFPVWKTVKNPKSLKAMITVRVSNPILGIHTIALLDAIVKKKKY